MDELDVRIVREMGVRPFERRPKNPDAMKPGHLAGKLGVTVNTIKARIARMEEIGVIAGYGLIPNLRHLGLAGSAYYFSLPPDDDKPAAIEAISALDGFLEVHDFLGRGFCVDFTHRDPAALEATLGELSKLTAEKRPIKFYDREMPLVERALTNLDWRILQALRPNGNRSLDDVGDALGVTGRTVRTRYARMAEEGSFFTVPMLDPSKAEGLVFFTILLYVQPGAFKDATRQLLADLDGNYVYAYVPSSPALGHLDVLLFARSTAQVEQLRQQAAAIPGVDRVEAWFFRGLYDHSGWIDAAIEQRVSETRAF